MWVHRRVSGQREQAVTPVRFGRPGHARVSQGARKRTVIGTHWRTHRSFRLAEGRLDVGDLLDEQQVAGDAAESERLVELGDPLMQGVHHD